MNQLTVWIFDDDVMALMRAKEKIESLESIANQRNMTLHIKCSKELDWPPKFVLGWPKEADVFDPQPLMPMPDIVILDLFYAGVDFRGKEVFYQLRAEERKTNKEAFIVIWSAYHSDEEALAFVETFEKGSHVIGLKTKDSAHLKEAVMGCMERVVEESAQI